MAAIHVTFRSIADSVAIKHQIQKSFTKLNQVHKEINHCRVVIDLDQKHQHHGKIFSVHIDVTLPGKELVSRKRNKNLYLAVRDSFHTLEQLLNKHSKKRIALMNKYTPHKRVGSYQQSATVHS